jgi:glycosyltransferase involved in cell wall biosynthesis
MINIHFVYSSQGMGLIPRIKSRFVSNLQKIGIPISYVGRRDKVDTSQWPFHAPISITHHVYNALRSHTKTLLYDWTEQILIPGGEKDILIGHPFPSDDKKVWNLSCLKGEFLIRIMLVPIHHGLPYYCGAIDPFIPLVDAVFGITGPYWYDTWENSAFAHWKPKIIPIDMAIDVRHYPRVKRKFNPKGKRKFLFIGNAEQYKGVHLLSILFGLATKHQCVWIGARNKLPNLDCRPPRLLTPDFMSKVASECDFFITMGISDANPTTILEAMAWGFPVSCTPQSGYYNMSEINQMSTTDMDHNLKMINKLQSASEEELYAQASSARSLVETRFTWDRFLDTLMVNLKKLSESKGLKLSD